MRAKLERKRSDHLGNAAASHMTAKTFQRNTGVGSLTPGPFLSLVAPEEGHQRKPASASVKPEEIGSQHPQPANGGALSRPHDFHESLVANVTTVVKIDFTDGRRRSKKQRRCFNF